MLSTIRSWFGGGSSAKAADDWRFVHYPAAAVLSLGPDDILLIRSQSRLTQETLDRMRTHFADKIGGKFRVLVADSSISLTAVQRSAPSGWLVADAAGERFRCWGDVGPDWTADRDKALWFVRREDAEAFSLGDEDAWKILPVAGAFGPTFRSCTQISEEAGITTVVFEDVAHIAKPLFPGIHNWMDELRAHDDDRLVGFQVWMTKPTMGHGAGTALAGVPRETVYRIIDAATCYVMESGHFLSSETRELIVDQVIAGRAP